MSGDGTDLLTGRTPQWTLQGPWGVSLTFVLLGAAAAASALSLAGRAWRAEEPLLVLMATASLLVLLPLGRLLQDLRLPVTLLPPQHRGEPLKISFAGEPAQPVSIRRALDGGGWMLLRIETGAAPRVRYRCVAPSGSPGEAATTEWVALRREVIAAETGRSAP